MTSLVNHKKHSHLVERGFQTVGRVRRSLVEILEDDIGATEDNEVAAKQIEMHYVACITMST